jgi:hypothetical protein
LCLQWAHLPLQIRFYQAIFVLPIVLATSCSVRSMACWISMQLKSTLTTSQQIISRNSAETCASRAENF